MSELKSRVLDVLATVNDRLVRIETSQLIGFDHVAELLEGQKITHRNQREIIGLLTGIVDGFPVFQQHVARQFSDMGGQVKRDGNAIQDHEGRIDKLEIAQRDRQTSHPDAE
jgi:hypothetical protein